jgi:hypothetical protein
MAMGYYFVGNRHISSPEGDVPSFPAPALARDMLCQLTGRGDGGIDHGELCRPTPDRRRLRIHRAWKPYIGQPAAAARERQKINRTGDL